jgi:polysaccharide export outer membrane protein
VLFRSDTTVAEAVEIAGGFTPASKHSRVLLIRRFNEGEVEVRILDLKKMLNKGDLREDAHLQPGDMVYVPQNSFSKWKDLLLPRPYVGTSINPVP